MGILIVMLTLLVKSKLPARVIVMSRLTVLITLRLAPLEGLLKSYSNPGVITVGVLFAVASGMYSTAAFYS